MTTADFVALMEPVARRLLGEPNRALSGAHELRFGNNGSVSVDLKKGVWHDFENDEGGGVLDLIKRETFAASDREAFEWLEAEGLWTNGKGDPKPKPQPHPKSPQGTNTVVVASFDYHDRDGVLRFVVERVEFQFIDGAFYHNDDGKRRKSFRQKRPDPHHPGKWIYDKDGCPVLIYRLPDVLDAISNDHRVFIFEGEGKVDLAWSWKVPATCNAGGAANWKPEHAEFLRDADVVIVGDNDDAGRNFVRAVGKSLLGVAKSVAVLNLPGLPPKGDIIDWAKKPAGISITAEQKARLRALGYSDDDIFNMTPQEAHEKLGTVEEFNALVERAAKPFVDAADASTLPFIDMSRWDDEPVPEQEWVVLNRIPRQQCVLFSGEGAAGKSTVQLHLSVAHVLGRDWLGSMPILGPALFIDAEDGEAVIHRRLAAITRHYGVSFADLVKGGLRVMSLFGQDAVLATVNRSGKIEPTELYAQILEVVGDIKPVMIGVASSANVYGGSEIDRPQVTQFISLMTRLAIVANGSVALISHPSLEGIRSDSGISGSTQWHNAVRARFVMKGVKAEAGEEPDGDLRQIEFKKNQYGPLSDKIVLRYRDGLFLPEPNAGSLDAIAEEVKAQDVFVAILERFTAEKRNASGQSGPNYAPALFAEEEEAKQARVTKKQLEAAMRRLFKAATIYNEPTPDSRKGRERFRLALQR